MHLQTTLGSHFASKGDKMNPNDLEDLKTRIHGAICIITNNPPQEEIRQVIDDVVEEWLLREEFDVFKYHSLTRGANK